MLKDSSDNAPLQDADAIMPAAVDSSAGIPGPKLPWGPLAAILYSTVLYVVAQIGVVLVMSLVLLGLGWHTSKIEDWLTNDTFAQFLYIASAEALTIGGIVWFVHHRGARMRSIGWNRLQLGYVGVALAGFGVYFIGYLITATLASALVPSLNLNQQQDIGFKDSGASIDMLLTFVSLVILPPLAEETVFRGFLYTGLRRRFPFLLATLITSVLFAIPHLQFGDSAPLLWVAALDTFVLSLVLCYVRERTNSLWPSIFIHAFKNGIAFVALFLIT